jgi:class 3 adenylate cyclase
LNAYLDAVCPAFHDNNGFIIQYIGDGILALFSHRDEALRASIQFQKHVNEFNMQNANSQWPQIAVGIGIHQGPVTVGTIGAMEYWSATVISDAVNTASRIEGLTKRYGAKVLTTFPPTKKSGIPFRFLGKVQPKGKLIGLPLYEILDGLDPYRIESRDVFAVAIQNLMENKIDNAISMLEKVIMHDPNDEVAKKRKEFAMYLLENNVPFDGIEIVNEK